MGVPPFPGTQKFVCSKAEQSRDMEKRRHTRSLHSAHFWELQPVCGAGPECAPAVTLDGGAVGEGRGGLLCLHCRALHQAKGRKGLNVPP